MTDTTEAKALREQPSPHGIYQLVMDENEALRRLLLEAQQVIAQRNGECDRLVNELEAERQRADGYRDCIRVLADQLSVNALPKEVIEAVAALKGELANPVVLPERWKPCDCIDCAYAYDSEATKKAINEAGFTVKGDL